MTYFREFRTNWHALLAAFVGIATGNALNHYTLSLFAPELIKAFDWSRSELALVSSLQIFTLVLVPFVGRFIDRFGARFSAALGFISMALCFIVFSTMNGSLIEFYVIWAIQHVIGFLTTSMVFARVIVERFDKARGSSLALLMMGPPLSGAVVAPLLGSLIAAEGWRMGYIALAITTAVGGIICISMMGRKKHDLPVKAKAVHLSFAEIKQIAGTRVFLLLVGGMLLINIPQVFAASQLKLIVMANGIADSTATWMVSLYAIGVIFGRFIFGLALDRIAAHVVALFALSMPVIGFVVLASSLTWVWIIAAGVLLIGVAQGAEGDIGAYMVSRHFELKNYSLVLGFVKAGLDGGAAIGALLLSYTLAVTDTYAPFLYISAAATIVGAICFFLTGHVPTKKEYDQQLVAATSDPEP